MKIDRANRYANRVWLTSSAQASTAAAIAWRAGYRVAMSDMRRKRRGKSPAPKAKARRVARPVWRFRVEGDLLTDGRFRLVIVSDSGKRIERVGLRPFVDLLRAVFYQEST